MAPRLPVAVAPGSLAGVRDVVHERDEQRPPRTRVALVGTLGDLHGEVLRYDLAHLRSLVERIEPDLLGIEAEPAALETDDPTALPRDVREALIPGTRLTDTVVVPMGGPSPFELAPPLDGELVGLRTALVRSADRLLVAIQRAADSPEAASGGRVTHLCGLVCEIKKAAAGTAGRDAWERTNERLLERVLWMVRRDPGRRVLVAVRCHRIHWLRARLVRFPSEIELVRFEQFQPAPGPAAARP